MGNFRFGKKHDREPFYAGKFYPAAGKKLEQQLDDLFAKSVKKAGNKKPRALIAPHAGYIYSGKVAASAYVQIPDKAVYKRVFVLAPSHHYQFEGASLFDQGNYKTPLGRIKTDTQLVEKLMASEKLFVHHAEAHLYEHSLEVQLPFLQHRLGKNFLLVPVIFGTKNPKVCEQIAHALEPWFTPENLFVVSTDFSHYPAYDDAVENDLETARTICSNNPETLLKRLKTVKNRNINHLVTSLCGLSSVLALQYLTTGKNMKYELVDYQNSGDAEMYSDKERVVGYWALGVYDKETPHSVTRKEQKELLAKARNVLIQFLETGKSDKPEPVQKVRWSGNNAGVFVSVYVKDELRGCIGNFEHEITLIDLVRNLTVSAACDERFGKLNADELKDLQIEISVLSPLKKIKSVKEIELGRHGIYIKKNSNSGTFLPKVAQKTGWTLEEFLGHCAHDKAGLDWNDWKTAELFTYEAFVFRG